MAAQPIRERGNTEMTCPFCKKSMGNEPEIHTLACALSVMSQGTNHPKYDLAVRIEQAARSRGGQECQKTH